MRVRKYKVVTGDPKKDDFLMLESLKRGQYFIPKYYNTPAQGASLVRQYGTKHKDPNIVFRPTKLYKKFRIERLYDKGYIPANYLLTLIEPEKNFIIKARRVIDYETFWDICRKHKAQGFTVGKVSDWELFHFKKVKTIEI